jgi:hypothetical protein
MTRLQRSTARHDRRPILLSLVVVLLACARPAKSTDAPPTGSAPLTSSEAPAAKAAPGDDGASASRKQEQSHAGGDCFFLQVAVPACHATLEAACATLQCGSVHRCEPVPSEGLDNMLRHPNDSPPIVVPTHDGARPVLVVCEGW